MAKLVKSKNETIPHKRCLVSGKAWHHNPPPRMSHFKKLHYKTGLGLALWIFCVLSASMPSGAQTEIGPPGLRPVPAGLHALVGATVVIKPGESITNAVIIVRDGLIEQVGAGIMVPREARVWDLKGQTVYPGFIDSYLSFDSEPHTKPKPDDELTAGGIGFLGVKKQTTSSGALTGPGYEVAQVKPERRMADSYQPDEKELGKMRELGFATANVVPGKGIICGTSAFVSLADTTPGRAIIRPDVFQHVAFDFEHAQEDVYPISLMGVIAVIRQAFFDAGHYALLMEYAKKHPGETPRPEYNRGMEALSKDVEQKRTFVFEPRDALMVDRSAILAKELGLSICIVSSGEEWRRPDLAKATGAPFIVPLNFPELPKMPDDADWQQVSLDEFRAWDWAPENAAVLQKEGLSFALTTHGLEDKKDFRKNLTLALDRGLTESNALAALTTVPARLCGVDAFLGTIEKGKLANFTIVAGTNYFNAESKVTAVWIDGRAIPILAGDSDAKKNKKDSDKVADDKTKPGTKDTSKKDDDKEKAAKLAKKKELQKRVARSPLEGRGVLADHSMVFITNATIWTCGTAGTLEHATMVVQGGIIRNVGTNVAVGILEAKDQAVLDGTGLSITPGIIDCHSHSMIVGDVNEGTLPSTAMVRIADVVNSETENIYEQLAGGVTTVNLLHGSANPIGGQNCVIKLRDGQSPESLKFAEAPQGIKFALGENVKQSNWGEKYNTRFPQTRMGVETFYVNRFTAAREYLEAWETFKKSGGPPPRRDLELEALGEILKGTRLIHCHSYRQDEILMLIRTMENFGVRIASFQHVLEGYKVADEIAKHGAGGSTFSDWWAYKIEVYDAIPYNGSLMRDRGVTVSFNSDSSELARRLYLEAAKAVKYGGTPEAEALKFVTLNAAIQLHIDKKVGSLEPGKDADFAIWSRSPLDTRTVCQQTWIEGKKYFDITLSQARATALQKEYDALLAKAKKLTEKDGDADEDSKDKDKTTSSEDSPKNRFFAKSLEHAYDGIVRHCLENEND
jgi:imidazolonepropionase-like amidohydrolase